VGFSGSGSAFSKTARRIINSPTPTALFSDDAVVGEQPLELLETRIGSTSESVAADGTRAAAVTGSTMPNEAATEPPATNNPEVADESFVTGRAVVADDSVVVDLPVAADIPVAAGDCPALGAATEHKALEPAADVQSDSEDKPAAG
jgi:hypothetical protein